MVKIKAIQWLKKISWRDLFYVFFWTIIWLKLFDVVAVKIVDKWQLFFSYYDGYRVPASVAAFMPFTLETLRADSAYNIVFTGDSTSGGLLYHHSQAIPAYLNTALNAQDRPRPIHTYNLAFSGAHLSEQYLLMKEVIANTDMVVFPIHYSFFSGRGPKNSFISHPELRDFLQNVNKTDLSLVGLEPQTSIDQLSGKYLGNIWYTYRVHRLLPYIIFGKPIRFWLRDKINEKIPLTRSASSIDSLPVNLTQPFSDQPKEVQQEILRQNQLLWKNVKPIDKTNINLQYLVKIGALANYTGKPFLAYFIPLDLTTLERNQNFDKNTYMQIIQVAKKTLTDLEIPFIDLNEGNPAQLFKSDFYNPDHLLPSGNQKVGNYLAKTILNDF